MSNKDSPAVSQLTTPSRSMAEAIEMIDRCQTFGTLRAVDHPAHRLGDRGPAHWGDRDAVRPADTARTPLPGDSCTNLLHVRNMLRHLTCDFFLLTNDTFPEEDLERLYLLPEDVEPPALLNLAFLSWTYNDRDETDVKSFVKAVKLLLSAREATTPAETGLRGRADVPAPISVVGPYKNQFVQKGV